MLHTDKQTVRQTNKQTNKQINAGKNITSLAEVIIIGALGTILKSLKRNLEELGADVASRLLQKSMVLGTAHITRKALGEPRPPSSSTVPPYNDSH